MKNKSAGFTIVELLIVIVVIGILAAITIVAYNGIQGRARDSRVDGDVRLVKTALEMYKADNGFYPSIGSDNSGYDVSLLGPVLTPNYIRTMPSNPGLLQYVRGGAGSNSYGIYMDYESKPDCKTGQNIAVGWWGVGLPTC
ncbi:MAG: hypothetical protein JWN33_233 [Candidatus Saccharibacteria bacterium]|nr:hypothetical protein [Candidatus Saccharibacteria bacterium]